MKKFISLIVLFLCLGCSKSDYGISIDSEANRYYSDRFMLDLSTKTNAETSKTYDTLYQQSTHLLLVNKGDPYRLSIIQSAYQKLKSDGIIRDVDLHATHRAITLYPRNEDELSSIEKMEDIIVSPFPFEYTPIPLCAEKEYCVFPELIKYRVTCEYPDNNTVELEMPILYSVWPIDKELPLDYDYTINYDVYLPNYSVINDTQIINALQLIEEEAFYINAGKQTRDHLPRETLYFSGNISSYDNVLDENLPLINLKVRRQLGSNIQDVFTDSNGDFSTSGPTGSSLSIVFQHDKWKITSGSSSTAYTQSQGSYNNSISGVNWTTDSFVGSIHRGANYCFTGNHPVTVPQTSSAIRISMTGTYETWYGRLNTGPFSTPYIQIPNNHMYGNHCVFSDVCHELGHYFHYLYRGGWLSFITMHHLFRESFAHYVAWRLSHCYYTFYNGGIDDPDIGSFTWNSAFGKDAQTWTPIPNDPDYYYSPIFIDLIDSYNQHLLDPAYNFDTISGKPDSLIESLVTDYDNWSQIRTRLQYYVYTYYTQYQLDQFVAPYNEYFN